LEPEYDRAAAKLKKNDPPISLAKVDCTSEKDTCDAHGVSGFPTLKIYKNGKFAAEYAGIRNTEGIVKYMRSQLGPSSIELKTEQDLEKFISHEDHGVVGFFEQDSRLRDSFFKVADTDRDRFLFAHTSAKPLLDKYEFYDDIAIFQPKQLRSKFEDEYIRYDGNYDTEKIRNFLILQMQGLCGIRTKENGDQFRLPLITVYHDIDFEKNPKGSAYVRNRVLSVAKEFKRKKVHFCVADRKSLEEEITEFGLSAKLQEKDSEPIVTGRGPSGQKYPMTAEFSIDNLKQFAQNLLDGSLPEFIGKSEPVPSRNDGPVKIVVANNFRKIVDQDKDVLIELYAPWCGHCKMLVPILEELGLEMSGESVVIAKMDATANDLPGPYKAAGYPTIYWVPKGKKDRPVVYPGGRSIDDFIDFIARESTKPLKKFDRNGKRKSSKKEL